MYVRPRLRVRPRNGGILAFSPASLFTSGVQGAWYDPSDNSTLFQDSAGTTPVTAVEQPVGLMLDKSQGLVLGSELVTNGDFASGASWTAGTNWSIGSGVATAAAVSGTNLDQTLATTAGNWYVVTYTVTSFTSGGVRFRFTGTANISGTVRSSAGTFTEYVYASVNNSVLRFTDGGGGFTGSIDNVSIKVIAGNHASQATTASRPVLRARYNLLTYSEQFDNAAWTKSSCSITPNQEVAPDGTTTVDLLQFSAQFGRLQQGSLTLGVVYTFSIWCRVASGTRVYSLYDSLGNSIGSFTATTTLTRYSITFTAPATATLYAVQDRNAGPFVDTYIWGADLRTGSSAGTYQRIAAATDYATAGFLPYLDLITDDSLSTGSIDFSATDKMFVCAGVTKNSDSATAVLAELSANSGANSGVFVMFAPGSPASKRFAFNSNGNAGAVSEAATTDTAYNAPFTAVLTGQADISGDSVTLRANATQVASSTADQGTGNYGNYPLYIGRRNNASLPANMRLFQLVVVGIAPTASQTTSTETFVNQKTAAY